MPMRWLAALMWLMLAAAAVAGPGLDPVEALPDAANEARARALFKELRCVVCQSESLDDSEADLARDMRKIVREQIAAGRSDQDIRTYLTQRYGDFVLLKTPSRPSTWVLWFGPFALLIGVTTVVGWTVLRRRKPSEAPLDAGEIRALEALKRDLPKSN